MFCLRGIKRKRTHFGQGDHRRVWPSVGTADAEGALARSRARTPGPMQATGGFNFQENIAGLMFSKERFCCSVRNGMEGFKVKNGDGSEEGAAPVEARGKSDADSS